MPHSPGPHKYPRLAFRRPAAIFRAMSSLPRAYLSQKLVQPLPTKEGVTLRTVGEAANYVLALPPERAEHRNRWRHAAKLLLDQADVADVSRQVHLALFYDAGAFLIVAVLVVVVVWPTLAPWL